MRYFSVLLTTVITLSNVSVLAENSNRAPEFPTDTYELYIDSLTEAFPGQDDLLIPLRISVSEPVAGINVTMIFDPSLVQPIVVAPNFFFQSFNVDLSEYGTLKINLLTDLPPPPYVPPIEGDTIFAWLMCEVMVEDPGYDVMTFLDFFEDPYTPYPDNSLLLENGGWITPPNLTLMSGDILIFSPLYGDININNFAYEIGDAVTFMNYFMGITEFNALQYANSDCNRDGIQATIADLVYLLCVINGDSVLVEPPPGIPDTENIAGDFEFGNVSPKILDNISQCDVFVYGDDLLGGAYFVIEYDTDEIEPLAVLIDSSAAPMDLSCSMEEGKLTVTVFNWNPSFSPFSAGKLFTVVYNDHGGAAESDISITKADFSDNTGSVADFEYSIDCTHRVVSEKPGKAEISVSSYPNPFNSSTAINFNLPSSGDYRLTIYDILGRRVRVLANGFHEAGNNMVIWDGTDENRRDIASGIYFARLHGEDSKTGLKLFMLK
ncbi:MAG: T9SS type A sorting domain-containing protein [candidate division Zixibacteria bacterium]